MPNNPDNITESDDSSNINDDASNDISKDEKQIMINILLICYLNFQ